MSFKGSIMEVTRDDNIGLLEEKLKYFVNEFDKRFEEKLKCYQQEAEIGAVPKIGKFGESIAGPAGAISGAGIGLATGIPGAVGGGSSAGGIIVKKMWNVFSGKQHKAKSKKIVEFLAGIEKYELRSSLTEAAGEIFRSYQFQFGLATDADGSWRRGIEKLAVDAVDRAMNYISAGEMKNIKTDVLVNFIVKAIVLGKSKEGVVATLIHPHLQNIPKMPKPGRTVSVESVTNQLKTSDIFERAGIVTININGEVIKYYKKKDKTSKPKSYGYRAMFAWEELINFEESDEPKGPSIGYTYKFISSDKFQLIIQDATEEINKKDPDYRLEKIDENISKEQNEISKIRELQESSKVMFESKLENVEKCTDAIKKVLNDIVDIKSTVSEEIKIFTAREHVKSFTGRVDELKEIHQLLRASTERVVISQYASISGLGGIGKTELARRYAFEYYMHYSNNVIWISAETIESLRRSFEDVANELKISIAILTENKIMERRDIKSIVKDVYKKLESVSCLLIFDNAEDFASIEPFLPKIVPGERRFYVLITSRNQNWDIGEEGDIPVVKLKGFSEEDAMEYVKTALKISKNDDSHDSDIRKLTETLQYFPLALRGATSYISETKKNHEKRGQQSYWIQDFLKEFEDEKSKKHLLNYSKAGYDRYTETVFTTWKITFKQIEQNGEYGKNALYIIEILAYFAPEKVPMEMFFCRNVIDEDVLWKSLELLENYALIDLKQGLANIHRLVQTVIQLWLSSANKEESIIKESLKILEDTPNELGIINQHVISIWTHAANYSQLIENYYFKNAVCYKTNSPLQLLAGANSLNAIQKILIYFDERMPKNKLNLIDIKDPYNRTPLYTSAENGCLDVVKVLAEKGSRMDIKSTIAYPSLSTRKGFGWNVLHVAAFNNHLDVVNYLYKTCKKLTEVKDSVGRTPAELAAYAGNMDVVKILEPNNHVLLLHAALRFAINNNDISNLEHVIQNLSEKDVINSIVVEWSPLHLVAFGGYEKIIELLIKNGANVNIQSDDGFTPLHAACSNGHLQAARLLIELGANQDAVNYDGWTIIHAAAQNGHPHVVEYLISIGFDANIKDLKGTTPLETAAYHSQLNVVELLTTRKFDVPLNINPVDILGATPVVAAMINYNCEIVKYLLRNGALVDPYISPKSLLARLGISILHVAAAYDELNICKVLVEEKNMSVNTGIKEAFTPLHFAAFFGNSRIVKYLVEKGADTYARIHVRQAMEAIEEVKKDTSLQKCNANTVIEILFRLMKYVGSYMQLIPGDLYQIYGARSEELPSEISPAFLKVLKFAFSIDYVQTQINNVKFYMCERKYPDLKVYVGGNFYSADDVGSTKNPLHVAIENNAIDVVEYIFKNDENLQGILQYQNDDGKTAFELLTDRLQNDPHNFELNAIKKNFLSKNFSNTNVMDYTTIDQFTAKVLISFLIIVFIAFYVGRFLNN